MKKQLIFVLLSSAGVAHAETGLGFGASYGFLTGTQSSNQGLFVQFDQGGFLVGSRVEAGVQQGLNPGWNLKAAVLLDTPAALGFKVKLGAGPEFSRDTSNNSWSVAAYAFVSPEFDLALGLSGFAELAYSKVLFSELARPDSLNLKAGVRFSF